MAQENVYQKLTPTDEVDLQVYEDAFKYIFGSITKLVGFRVPDIVPSAHVK